MSRRRGPESWLVALALAWGVGSASACVPGEGASGEATSAATTSSATAATTTSGEASVSASSTSVATAGSTTATSTTVATSEASTGDPCALCGDGFLCIDGVCYFDPGCCGEATIQIPMPARDVVLVVDKSGSTVATLWDHDDDPNTAPVARWSSLARAIEHLALNYEHSLNLGLVLAPGLDATSAYSIAACPVAATPEVAVAPINAAALLAALPGADAGAETIAGATPTRAAILAAADHLLGQGDGLAPEIILMLDGAANCDPDAVDDGARLESLDDGAIDAVTQAREAGVRTFVVGVDVADVTSPIVQDGEPDGVNLHDFLDLLAVAGGAPLDDPEAAFHDGADEAGLIAALDAIAGELLPCTITLDPPPKDAQECVELEIDGVEYGVAQATCGGADGWRYVGDGFAVIELCGQACVDARQAGTFELRYRCSC